VTGAAGNVEFLDGTTSLGSKPLVGTAATLSTSTSTLTIGGHAMSAVYAGGSNHATSTSSMLAQNVGQAASNPDGGVGHDAGTIDADGGLDAGVSDAPASDSGCGCHTTPISTGGALAALPLLGLALLLARRRRRA